jgi:5-methylcytosine-specific restriction endonuclease McrA
MPPLDPSKKCTKCGEIKPMGAFTRWKKGKDGRFPSCKACKYADHKRRVAANPEFYAAKQAEYDRRYTEKHPERVREAKQRWYSENHEKARETANKWTEKNREKVRLYIRMANARRRANGGRNSTKLVGEMLLKQKSKCTACKTSLKAGYHIDHVMPLKLGGTNDRSNLQLLCPRCNLQKKATHPIDFMQSRGFLL